MNDSLEPSFIEDEEIVSKFQMIEYLEKHFAPYRLSGGVHYFARVQKTLETIPTKYHNYAFALFANAIYLPEPLLDKSWTYLLDELSRRLALAEEKVIENIMLFEINGGSSIYRFIQENNIKGRLDINRFPRGIQTIDQLIDEMYQLVSKESGYDDLKQDIRTILTKKYWILLSDNALSGTSIFGDIEKATELFKLLGENLDLPIVVPLVQVCTEDAERKISDKIKSESGSSIEQPIIAFRLDSRFKITKDNASNCKLFLKKETLEGILELCEWFVQNTSFKDNYELKETKLLSGDDMRYGFKAGGWTLITPNCPENSLPLFWYRGRDFCGPFPRVRSRIGQSHGRGREKLRNLSENREQLKKRLDLE
jgi:hypothetical protein